MRYVAWALRILLFVLLFGFALKNTAPVTVRFYLGSVWEAPLALVLLVFFAAGAAAGVAACLGHAHRQRREILELRRGQRGKPALPEEGAQGSAARVPGLPDAEQ
jgi:uncharacterized integral membrane protein